MDNINIKGVGVITIRNYVRDTFPEKYQDWLKKLAPESKNIFSNKLSATEWYSVKYGVIEPIKIIAELFHNNDCKLAGIKTGEFSASYTLTGVYKAFLIITTPNALMSASQRIFSRFYTNTNIKIDEKEKQSLVFSATKIDPNNKNGDYNIIGWGVRALELIKCKNVQFEELEEKYDGMFTVRYSWE